jgi:uncharacterized protein YciI
VYYVLLYDYAKDVAERRGPYRPGHLALLNQLKDDGKLVMAGAWTDPLDGAAFVFKGDDKSGAEAFVKIDPYVANGLVTHWRVREWNVVVGG